jgi:hypothetical protein
MQPSALLAKQPRDLYSSICIEAILEIADTDGLQAGCRYIEPEGCTLP